MNTVQWLLLSVISLGAVALLAQWLASARRHPEGRRPTWHELTIGFVTNFFDTLGVGSFPTSTSYFRLRHMVADELIPGTLNIGHAPAAIAEALIFITAVPVNPALLGATTIATAAGAWLGAGTVVRLPRAGLLWVLALGSLSAAVLIAAANLGWLPGGGVAFDLSQVRFLIAIVVVFVLGALMAAGVGFFGPCMIALSLLGMHPLAAFPIMMSAGAVQQIVSGLRYLRANHYQPGTAVGLGIGGVVGVIVAAFFVRALPVTGLRWLVALVALYVGFDFLRATGRCRTATRRNTGASSI